MAPGGFDYSKWDKLELSDDEDLHPGAQFIEANTLRRIKRESHQNRAEEIDNKIKEFEKEIKGLKKEIKQLEISIVTNNSDNRSAASIEKEEEGEEEVKLLEKLESKLKEVEELLKQEMKKRTFNADEMCKVTSSKTLIGDACAPSEVSINVRAQKMSYEDYCDTYENELDELAKHGDETTKKQNSNAYARIEAYLSNHSYLVCEHALGYLLLKALYQEMDGVERQKMLDTAKAGFALKSISDFATAQKRTMLDQFKPFFARLQSNEKVMSDYEIAELEYVEKLIERAAKKKIEEQLEQKEVKGGDEDTQRVESPPLGPGGLDPREVFESLPKEMQTAFESGNVEALRDYVNELSMEDAKFYMRRMVDSGLWVPEEGAHPGAALVDDENDDSTHQEEDKE